MSCIADALRSVGDDEARRDNLDRSLGICHGEMARALNVRATLMAANNGSWDVDEMHRAQRHAIAMVQITSRQKDFGGCAIAYQELALAARRTGDITTAIQAIQAASELHQDSGGMLRLCNANRVRAELLVEASASAATADECTAQLAEAEALVYSTLQKQQQVYATLTTASQQVAVFEEFSRLYNLLQYILHSAGEPSLALVVADLGRARSLLAPTQRTASTQHADCFVAGATPAQTRNCLRALLPSLLQASLGTTIVVYTVLRKDELVWPMLCWVLVDGVLRECESFKIDMRGAHLDSTWGVGMRNLHVRKAEPTGKEAAELPKSPSSPQLERSSSNGQVAANTLKRQAKAFSNNSGDAPAVSAKTLCMTDQNAALRSL